MQIIPVIDLKDGVVVRAVAGQRELYRPVESVLGCDVTARGVADAFASHFGFHSVYVADLDAIAGAEPNWAAYEAIASAGLRLMVDSGTNSVERAASFIGGSSVSEWCWGVVVGLETLQSKQDVAALCAAIGPERAIFSLDLRNGKPLTEIPVWSESVPIEIVDAVVDMGFRRLIVLDLASVGREEGVSVRNHCTAIRVRHPRLEITSGGGLRHRLDLIELASAGCDAALVASALHNGSLTKEVISEFHCI